MIRQFLFPSTNSLEHYFQASESPEPNTVDFTINGETIRLTREDWRDLRRVIEDFSFNWDGMPEFFDETEQFARLEAAEDVAI